MPATVIAEAVSCSVEGCLKLAAPYRKGFCYMHHGRWKKTGDPLKTVRLARGVCKVLKCDRPHKAHGWCQAHYERVRNSGELDEQNPIDKQEQKICAVVECPKPNYGFGYCEMHYYRFKKHGVTGLAQSTRKETWGTGEYTSKDGYRYVKAPEHPNATSIGFVLEHVKVMSETLGRALIKGEEVHHKNGIRDDNRPSNLELWTKSQPSGQRVSDRLEHAVELLHQYLDNDLVWPEHLLNTKQRLKEAFDGRNICH